IDNDIRLEHTHAHHAQDIFNLVSKEANRELFRQWLIWVDNTQSIEDTKAFIQSTLDNYAKGSEVNCSIVYQERLVGNVALLGMRNSNGVAKGELGYWLDGEYHGKGIMSKAVQKMVAIGFEYYALDKIIIRCATQNRNSCNIPKRLGFVHEGILRADIRVGEQLQDGHIFSLLKDEYERANI
ncbi:MAG: GNAT family N-acetyltransferase, partial [Campylobacterales bacterium]|nr:GNAT family N-acetyltransferase [Campylobacterales bacterium]